jgi:hypothetical protein
VENRAAHKGKRGEWIDEVMLGFNVTFYYSTAPPDGLEAAFSTAMNNAGHLPISETARRAGKAKARRGRPRKNSVPVAAQKEPPAVGTLTRTKSLLLAALRVWELKHRISE